jgi:hypothetical protein
MSSPRTPRANFTLMEREASESKIYARVEVTLSSHSQLDYETEPHLLCAQTPIFSFFPRSYFMLS